MLVLVNTTAKKRSAQTALARNLISQLNSLGVRNVGYPGGNRDTKIWGNGDRQVWYARRALASLAHSIPVLSNCAAAPIGAPAVAPDKRATQESRLFENLRIIPLDGIVTSTVFTGQYLSLARSRFQ